MGTDRAAPRCGPARGGRSPHSGAYLGLDQGRGCETPGRQSAKIPKSQNWRLLRRERAASGGPGRFRGHQGKSQWRTQGWEWGFFSLRGDEGHRGVLGLKPAFWHLDLPSAVHQLWPRLLPHLTTLPAVHGRRRGPRLRRPPPAAIAGIQARKF